MMGAYWQLKKRGSAQATFYVLKGDPTASSIRNVSATGCVTIRTLRPDRGTEGCDRIYPYNAKLTTREPIEGFVRFSRDKAKEVGNYWLYVTHLAQDPSEE